MPNATIFIASARDVLAARGILMTIIGDPESGTFGVGAVIDGKSASVSCYRTGKVSIGGNAQAADALCGPLAEAGLLDCWTAGARGAGVFWRAPDSAATGATPDPPLKAAIERVAEALEADKAAEIATWLEGLARAAQRSAGGDLLGQVLAAYAGPGGWHGAYEALAGDLHAAGFRVELGTDEATRRLGLDAPPAGGSVFVRGLGVVSFAGQTARARLVVDARQIDQEINAGVLYWLRRALAPASAEVEEGAPWE